MKESIKTQEYVGIDLGEKHLVTAYDGAQGKHFSSEIKTLRNSYNHTGNTEKKEIKARFRGKIIVECERIANELMEMYSEATFIFEAMPEFKSLPSDLKKAGFEYYQLHEYMISRGARLRYVNRNGTSITCPICGYSNAGNRKASKQLFQCLACHYTDNDDVVAAMNIRMKGMKEEARMQMKKENATWNQLKEGNMAIEQLLGMDVHIASVPHGSIAWIKSEIKEGRMAFMDVNSYVKKMDSTTHALFLASEEKSILLAYRVGENYRIAEVDENYTSKCMAWLYAMATEFSNKYTEFLANENWVEEPKVAEKVVETTEIEDIEGLAVIEEIAVSEETEEMPEIAHGETYKLNLAFLEAHAKPKQYNEGH